MRELYHSIARRLESGELEKVELFFHPIQIADKLGNSPLSAISEWFTKEVWPWPVKPYAYIDNRLLSGSSERCYQHAKVVIADAMCDNAKALVTSANFSETAQRHNFEAGWLTSSPQRAQEIHRQFSLASEQGLFVRLPLADHAMG